MRTLIWTFAVFVSVGLASASAATAYTLTKYDDPAFATFCYSLDARVNYHLDAAVTDGSWGICSSSDRHETWKGPGFNFHGAALYRRTSSGWTLALKGGGNYFTLNDLQEARVPAADARRLLSRFKSDICHRGDVPATEGYCANH